MKMNLDNFLKDFVVIIGTHGRPDQVKTYNTLRKQGYTGDIILLLDNEDKTIEKYKENFKNKCEIVIFDKRETNKIIDVADNFPDRRSTIYWRTESFNVAKKYNKKSFVQLDDDYTDFKYLIKDGKKLLHIKINNLNKVFYHYVEFLQNSNITSVAMAQCGEMQGGVYSIYAITGKRKAMNSFFCLTDKPFKFYGKLNEDVNTYIYLGSIGQIFLTHAYTGLIQAQTQATKGGMTEAYLKYGTYVKSFYSKIFMPSCIKVQQTFIFKRLHHRIDWNACVPKILNEKWKK